MGLNGFALFILCIFGFLFLLIRLLLKKRKQTPSLGFSSLHFFKGAPKSLKARFVYFPQYAKTIALFSFAIAFLDPYVMLTTKLPVPEEVPKETNHSEQREEIPIPSEGVAIYLVLDQSGSMNEGMFFANSKGERFQSRRIDILKQVTSQFIKGNVGLGLHGRPNDIIGLIFFARKAKVIAPLTLDHARLLEELGQMDTVKYDDENGTAIGYALFKTVHLIKTTKHFSEEMITEGMRPPYDIKSTVIVLVTDGIQEPNPRDSHHNLRTMDLMAATRYAEEAGVKVYVININPDIRYARFARAKSDLEHIAKATGGRFFIADNPKALTDIYREIDILEKDILPVDKTIQANVEEDILATFKEPEKARFLLYPYFIGFGLCFLALSIIAENTILRRVV
jgi:Ca-activated chloride channel family protein